MMRNKNNICCCIFKFLSTLIAAVGISALFFEGLIANIIVLVYLALILGIVSLIFTLFFFFCRQSDCECLNTDCLLANSVLSIILSIIALTATSLATFSIPVTIFIGALTFIFLNNIVSLVNTIICLTCNNTCN